MVAPPTQSTGFRSGVLLSLVENTKLIDVEKSEGYKDNKKKPFTPRNKKGKEKKTQEKRQGNKRKENQRKMEKTRKTRKENKQTGQPRNNVKTFCLKKSGGLYIHIYSNVERYFERKRPKIWVEISICSMDILDRKTKNTNKTKQISDKENLPRPPRVGKIRGSGYGPRGTG